MIIAKERLLDCDDLYVHNLGDILDKLDFSRIFKTGKCERLYYYWIKEERPISIGDLKKILSKADLNLLLKRIKFISAYASPHMVILPKKFSEDLAYLCGYHLGDGCISRNSLTIHYMDSEEQLILVSKIYRKLFGISLIIKKDYRKNAFNGTITSKALALFLHKCLGFSLGRKDVLKSPEFIETSLRKSFVIGFMDAEFGVNRKKYQFSGSSIDKEFIEFIQSELKSFGLDLKFYGPYCCDDDPNPRWFLKTSKKSSMYWLLENKFIRHPNHLKILKSHFKSAPIV